jgi:hypothetical protein
MISTNHCHSNGVTTYLEEGSPKDGFVRLVRFVGSQQTTADGVLGENDGRSDVRIALYTQKAGISYPQNNKYFCVGNGSEHQ